MNANTFAQLERYLLRSPPHRCPSGVEQSVLIWLVHAHDATAGVSSPGVRWLVKRSGFTEKTVCKALDALVAGGHIVLIRRHPRNLRLADEYAVPWLRNGPVDNQPSSGKFPTRPSGKSATHISHTSTPLRGVGDATHADESQRRSATAALCDASLVVDLPPLGCDNCTGGWTRDANRQLIRCSRCNPPPARASARAQKTRKQ